MTYTLGALADLLGGTVDGDPGVQISDVADIESAEPSHISYLASSRARKHLEHTHAGALVVAPDYPVDGYDLLRIADPQSAFFRLVHLFRPLPAAAPPGIAPTSVVADTAQVDPTASVGAYAVVGDQAVIQARCVIMPHTVIGPRTIIGEDTVLHPHVTIGRCVMIGRRVVVQAGAVIGSEGFGYRKTGDRYEHIPHRGRVILEDDVEIGANCTIDRGTIGDTVVGAGSKLDNLVHLAHNVKVGRNVVMAAQVGISGSTRIEDRVAIGGQAGLVEHLVIAHDSVIGAQAGLTKSVKEPGSAVWGYPAKSLKEAKRIEIYLRRLPELVERFDTLIKRLTGGSDNVNDISGPLKG